MQKLPVMLASLLPLLVPAQPFAAQPTAGQGESRSGRTVLVFLPQQFFSDDEYEPLVRHLDMAGLRVKVTANETTPASSMSRDNQLVVKPDLALRDVRVEDFDGLLLVGGSGAALYWDDSLLQARCRDFDAADKVVAAIGVAPITLARAGVLAGRKATVFYDRSAIGFLKEKGCRYSFRPVVTDRNIITAQSAEYVGPFGRILSAAVLRN